MSFLKVLPRLNRIFERAARKANLGQMSSGMVGGGWLRRTVRNSLQQNYRGRDILLREMGERLEVDALLGFGECFLPKGNRPCSLRALNSSLVFSGGKVRDRG